MICPEARLELLLYRDIAELGLQCRSRPGGVCATERVCDQQRRQCGTATDIVSSFEIRKASIAIRQLSSRESSFMISRLPRDRGRLKVQGARTVR